MAWYPRAERLTLQPEASEQSSIRPTQLIVHSIVAPWDEHRLYAYWRDSTSLESHFGLDYDGSMGQYLPTTVRADANAAANRRSDGTGAISIETASNTSASDPWTPEQVEALIGLGVWAHRTHGIPLRICRDAADPGFGWHRLHPEWSTSGTACPGPRRIEQFRDEVFPAIRARATGEDEEMTDEQMEQLADMVAARVWSHMVEHGDSDPKKASTYLVSGHRNATRAASAAEIAVALMTNPPKES